MSVHVSSWVWKHAPAAGNRLLVLLALADIANDDGVAWPSRSHLAEKTRLSISTVKRVLSDLRADGVLVADVTLGRSSVYRIVTTDPGHSAPQEVQSDPGQVEPGQSEPGSHVTRGVGHSYDPGGGSTVTLYTSETHQDTSLVVDDADIPKGSRAAVVLPRPWLLTPEMRAWAAANTPSVDVEDETRGFVEYWREGEGRGKKKKNWELTWRNRLKAQHQRNVTRGWKPGQMANPDEWMYS